MEKPSEVVIIGGGIIGLACAHYLLDHNVGVRIIERDRIGRGASAGNCGLLHFSSLIPLCAPGVVGHEIRRALTGSSPLFIKPRFDPGLFYWLYRFAAQCKPEHKRAAAGARDKLLQYSRELFRELFATHPLDCDLTRKGLLYLFTDQQHWEHFQAVSEFLAQYGFSTKRLDRAETQALEPAISDQVIGSWHKEQDWNLRPDQLITSWKELLLKRGAIIEEESAVLDIATRAGTVQHVKTVQTTYRADAFVLANGAWSPQLGKKLGLTIPVQPGKGYSITMDRPEGAPEFPCLLHERNMVVTPWESGFRLGGTMEFSGYNDNLNGKRLGKLLRGTKEYLTTRIGEQLSLEQWSGLRPLCYDDLPIIGPARTLPNLYLATGHGMLGLTMAPGTGKAICDLICAGQSEIDLSPFSPERFRKND
jgi:D-amino-acid dehydrogenase